MTGLPVRAENIPGDSAAGGAVLLHDLPVNNFSVVASVAAEPVVIHRADPDLVAWVDLAISTRLHLSLLEEGSDVRFRGRFLGPAQVPQQRGLNGVGP